MSNSTVYVVMEQDQDNKNDWYCEGVYTDAAMATRVSQAGPGRVIHVTGLIGKPRRFEPLPSPTRPLYANGRR